MLISDWRSYVCSSDLKVAWVQTSTLSSLSRNAPTLLTLPPSSPGALHRFHFGVTVQSAQKPNLVSGSSAKLEPMLFSGTTMMAWRKIGRASGRERVGQYV